MKKFLFGILILALAPLVLFAAPDNTQERIDYEVFKARTEANIESLKSIKSQDLTKFETELNTQKTLIDQINHQIDAFGNNLTIGSTIVTILLLLIGFFTYKNAKTDAQNTAKEVVQSEVKNWFNKNANDLTQEIEQLRQNLKKLEEEASVTAANTTAEMKKHLSEVVSKSIDANTPVITQEEKIALNAKIEELKSIAEAMYKFEDWNTKAFAAFHQNDFLNAAKFWDKAAQSTDATDVQKAQSLFNKGVTQSVHIEPKQPEAAIATYDALIQRFGNSKHFAVKEQVARAFLNKGVTQRQALDQPDAAIATYDALIQSFGNSEHVAVQEQVARAFLNKAITQGKHLKQPEDEIATYDALIERFGNSEHVAVQEQVAGAYNSMGFDYLINAKQAWRNITAREQQLKTALEYFNKAISSCSNNHKGMVLGNIAYANWLLGIKVNTEQQLTEALTIGGKELYDATIKDTETHPVARDKTFKALLDKVWQTIPQDKSDS